LTSLRNESRAQANKITSQRDFTFSFAHVAEFLFVMYGGIRRPALAVKVEDIRRSPLGFAFSDFDEAEVGNACLRCISLLPVQEGPTQVRSLNLNRQHNVQRGEQESHV
jgi:hypothetical protein